LLPAVAGGNIDSMDDSMQLLGRSQLAQRLGVSRQQLWRWERYRWFPPGVRLAGGRTLWRLAEVIAWLDERWPLKRQLYMREGPGKPAVPMPSLADVPLGWEWCYEGAGAWHRRIA
jgi:predicted DNA-binding transcriptional regulator AlpA